MEKKTCTSCNTDISTVNNPVEFPCPSCGKTKINRCGKCRKISAKYKCEECGFEGP